MKNHFPKVRINGGIVKLRTLKAVLVMLAAYSLCCGKLQGKENKQQLWLISTRSAPLAGDLQSGLKAIRYWQFSGDGQWQPSDEESLRGGDDPAAPMTIVIHGNRDDPDDAVEFAWPIYCRMLKIAEDKRFKLVIWSWPGEQMCRRNRADVQLKFNYCDAQAYYLARHLQRVRPEVPLCLIGFSMGAKIIGGGLQLLAGGEVNCRKLPEGEAKETTQNRTAPMR